jgi:hypothetical protein
MEEQLRDKIAVRLVLKEVYLDSSNDCNHRTILAYIGVCWVL